MHMHGKGSSLGLVGKANGMTLVSLPVSACSEGRKADGTDCLYSFS